MSRQVVLVEKFDHLVEQLVQAGCAELESNGIPRALIFLFFLTHYFIMPYSFS